MRGAPEIITTAGKAAAHLKDVLIKTGVQRITRENVRKVDEKSADIEKRIGGGGSFNRFREELLLALGIVKHYCSGDYRRIPWWAVAAVTFMFLYLVSPIDLIPDFIPGLGQVDDLLVISVCLFMVRRELHLYEEWRDG